MALSEDRASGEDSSCQLLQTTGGQLTPHSGPDLDHFNCIPVIHPREEFLRSGRASWFAHYLGPGEIGLKAGELAGRGSISDVDSACHLPLR